MKGAPVGVERRYDRSAITERDYHGPGVRSHVVDHKFGLLLGPGESGSSVGFDDGHGSGLINQQDKGLLVRLRGLQHGLAQCEGSQQQEQQLEYEQQAAAEPLERRVDAQVLDRPPPQERRGHELDVSLELEKVERHQGGNAKPGCDCDRPRIKKAHQRDPTETSKRRNIETSK